MTWRDGYFDENYIEFYKDIITPERTAREVVFLQSIFDPDTKRILDMPCGFGRHAIELAKRGYSVTGVDFYNSQLDIARENSKELANISFVKGDMRSYIGENFDAALNLFTSFGYFDRNEDSQVLRNLVSSVKKDGIIVIDVRNTIRFSNDMANTNWRIERRIENGYEIEQLDPTTNKLSMTYERRGMVKKAELNLYTPEEYTALFQKFNCIIEHMYGGFDGSEFSAEKSPRLIIVARRNK